MRSACNVTIRLGLRQFAACVRMSREAMGKVANRPSFLRVVMAVRVVRGWRYWEAMKAFQSRDSEPGNEVNAV